jgi:hypothetical protein
MKKLFIAGLLVLALVQNASAVQGVWSYGAVVTNPTTSTVFTTVALPTSGSVASPPTANYFVGAFLYCSVAATYQLQVLDASSVLQATVPFVCSTTGPNIIPAGTISYAIQDGWKIQIIPSAGFTGFGSAQLFYAVESIN